MAGVDVNPATGCSCACSACSKVPSVDLETRLWDDYAPTGVLFPLDHLDGGRCHGLMLGGFVPARRPFRKFGDPAAGASGIFLKAR